MSSGAAVPGEEAVGRAGEGAGGRRRLTSGPDRQRHREEGRRGQGADRGDPRVSDREGGKGRGPRRRQGGPTGHREKGRGKSRAGLEKEMGLEAGLAAR